MRNKRPAVKNHCGYLWPGEFSGLRTVCATAGFFRERSPAYTVKNFTHAGFGISVFAPVGVIFPTSGSTANVTI